MFGYLLGWLFGWLQCWDDTNVTLAFEEAQVIPPLYREKTDNAENTDDTGDTDDTNDTDDTSPLQN